jgi:hypothetical protein
MARHWVAKRGQKEALRLEHVDELGANGGATDFESFPEEGSGLSAWVGFIIFWWWSLPLLLPRSWLAQGIVSALSGASGYMMPRSDRYPADYGPGPSGGPVTGVGGPGGLSLEWA